MLPVWVQSIQRLQEADGEVDRIGLRLAMFPAECKRIVNAKNAADARMQAASRKIALQRDLIRKMEAEVHVLEEKRNRTRQQSALVRRNEEYQTLLAECAMLGKAIGEAETKVLEAMEDLPLLEKEAEEIKAGVLQEIRRLKQEYQEFGEAEKSFKAELAAARAKRETVAGTVNRELLDVYEELRRSKEGGAPMVAVQKGGVCGHCCLKLTPQTLATAKAGKTVQCENCRHLIYWDEV